MSRAFGSASEADAEAFLHPSVPVPVEMIVEDLQHAIEIGVDDKGWTFEFDDIAWIEATWLLADGNSTSAGVIAKLKDGRRVYFDYVGYQEEEDGFIERVDMLPMGDESYPAIGETGTGWLDAPAALNNYFGH